MEPFRGQTISRAASISTPKQRSSCLGRCSYAMNQLSAFLATSRADLTAIRPEISKDAVLQLIRCLNEGDLAL